MRKIYQPVAVGRRDWCDGTHTIMSKRVFSSRVEAEEYVPEFREKVTTVREDRPLTELMAEDLKITIAELELHESLGVVDPL